MSINSDFDVLLIAVNQMLQIREHASERIQALRDELEQAEGLLEDTAETASSLAERLKDAALRAGYLRNDQMSDMLDLETLETLVLEGISVATNSTLPDNVVVLSLRKPTLKPPHVQESDDDSISLQQAVRDALDGLTMREANTLRHIFGIDTEDGKALSGRQIYTQDYAARLLDLSQPTISRIYRRALRKLRYPHRSERLRTFISSIDFDHVRIREENLLIALFGISPIERN